MSLLISESHFEMTAVATWPSKMCSFGLKGTADPLLCQDPRTVLPTYASLMDTEAVSYPLVYSVFEIKGYGDGGVYSCSLFLCDNQ